jgi:hypothetical protein
LSDDLRNDSSTPSVWNFACEADTKEARDLKFIKAVEIPPYHYGVVFQHSGV